MAADADSTGRYTDHTYMVLTLQKLVHLHPDGEKSDSDKENEHSIMQPKKPKRKSFKTLRKLFASSKARGEYDEKRTNAMIAGVHDPTNTFVTGHIDSVHDAPVQKLRTLQRYHGGPNHERMAFMEAHSPLTRRKLAVSAEQVSIFLTAGICWFLTGTFHKLTCVQTTP